MKNKLVLTSIFAAAVLAVSAFALAVPASAQSNNYQQRYNNLVARVGAAGVGVETLLDNWEKVDSADVNLLSARFNFWFTKSRSEEIVTRPEKRYLGMDPVLSLKDSLGNDVYYFQEPFFDDECYGQAIKTVDRAISLHPQMLEFRFMKANAYIAYEKGSPDMALAYLTELASKCEDKGWEYEGKAVEKAFFKDAMNQYCYSFYLIGTQQSMEAFRALSEKMLQLYPNDAQFMNNIGAYYMVGCKEPKKAYKQYCKVLKKYPQDYTALKNCILITRRLKNFKNEAKHLEEFVKIASDQEKSAAEMRLKALKTK